MSHYDIRGSCQHLTNIFHAGQLMSKRKPWKTTMFIVRSSSSVWCGQMNVGAGTKTEKVKAMSPGYIQGQFCTKKTVLRILVGSTSISTTALRTGSDV